MLLSRRPGSKFTRTALNYKIILISFKSFKGKGKKGQVLYACFPALSAQ
jgi:hypothetical protein